MNFLSFEWFFIMGLTVGFYWILPAHVRAFWIILFTAVFLALLDIRSLALLSFFALVIFLLTYKEKIIRQYLLVGIFAILAALFYFKIEYRNHFQNPVLELGIPLGLSYFAFRCLHLLIEIYRGTIKSPSAYEILTYLFFLPTIVIGPINRATAFFQDQQTLQWRFSDLSEALERILYGYVKIAFLGNFFITGAFGLYIQNLDPSQVSLRIYLSTIQNGLNLYIQFSGFSDIAIGFALLLGYRVMENFDWPYFKKNIVDFWRAWHISLTSWSRDYVYMPLIGIYRNPYLASITSFVFIGLWHDVTIQYLAWGLYHAAGVIIWQHWQRIKRRFKLAPLQSAGGRFIMNGLSIIITVHFVMFSFIIVREPDLMSAAHVFWALLTAWI